MEKIVKEVATFASQQMSYAGNLEKKMEELDREASFLFARRDDVQEKINGGPPNAATSESKLWLDYVKKVERKVESIRADHEKGPNFISRVDLGKRIGDVMDEITSLNNKRPKLKGKEFSIAPLERVQPQNVEVNSPAAAEHTLQKVLGFMEDDKIQRIGIWGMGGVGKTRVMKLLNNRPEVSQRFEIIIWITVSKDGDERKVQNAIAERLNLNVSESDDQLKASILQTLNRKKFLILLDDVWNFINLFDIGIPTPNHQVNGSKIVLTTRCSDVCRQMKTDEDVKVETLPKDEAWTLFTENVGDVAMTPSIEQFARDIVAECDGLPLAIIVVGSSLRKIGDVVVWRNTLRELQSPATSQSKDMEERVFRCLRYSYERLQDDYKMKLFLYCSLYPEDYMIKINELVEYCWLEGYIHGVSSIQDARDKGHTMVMNLVDASLLEKVLKTRVKMHDIIRDFAMKEASGFLVKTGKHVRQTPMENEWLQLEKMSMMRCSLQHLSESWNCSIMSTLLLGGSAKLTMISDSFFELMPSLSILDLSGTNIESLPLSLFNLVKLRGLYLRNCVKLKDLSAQVGQLKQLQVLHLGKGTRIISLPIEVGELSGLKRLIVGFRLTNFSDYSEKRNMKLTVPTGIIPNLSLLEEVGMYTSKEEQWDDESVKVVVDELCRLEHLTYLDFYFPKEEYLVHFLNERKLRKASCLSRFRFQVGPRIWKPKCLFSFFEHEEWENCLAYTGGDEISHGAIMEILPHCSLFRLKDRHTSQKLSEFGMTNMNGLRKCWIGNCENMEVLFDGNEEQQTCAILPSLEELDISKLPNLRSLWVGPLLPGSLSKLTRLYLRSCGSHRMKKVFQLAMIQQLPSLEFLQIFSCSSVEEIIGNEDETSIPCPTHISSNGTIILPNVKHIFLHFLPELVSICQGVSLEWPSLESIYISNCPKLRSLSSIIHGNNNVPPALKEIKAPSSWWEALEWEDNDIKQRLQPLFRDKNI